MSIISDYKKKTGNSAKIFSKSLRFHVNGVSHNIRFYEPYPFVTRSSAGKNLIDVDNNKYTDYWMGHWSLILGHGSKHVKDSLKKQIDKSWMYGTVNEQTVLLSEIISKAVPVAEKIRYVTSGTEATMYAVRLARSATGRKIIAKIDGGWHGYTSDLLKSVNWPFTESESSGVVNEEHIVSIPYNDLERSLEILKKYSKELAGVIIEPILGGGGCIPATKEYLTGIQEFIHKNNSLFILDEIVTGFRFEFGCLYSTMELDPDIVTLGKIVGGGMPIGVLCGKKEIMQIADTTDKKKSERSYIGGGTFSANPMSMTSGFATLTELKKSKNTIYLKINALGEFARDELKKLWGQRVIITGKGSLFMTHFPKNESTEIVNSAQAAKCDIELLHRYHFKMIAQDGIFFLPGKLGAISNAHTKDDIKKIILASENFDMQQSHQDSN
jgi:glutamate-1-semialdehyde 2,1-aminomutase